MMTSLAGNIGHLWVVSASVPGGLVRGEDVKLHQVDGVIIAIGRALTDVRVIETVGFRGSDGAGWGDAYRKARGNDSLGKAVAGLVGPRNADIHAQEVVEPSARRVVGPSLAGTFAVDFCWKRTGDVPRETFCNYGEFNKNYQLAYEEGVGGRRVPDVLMDAFWFFCLMAPQAVDLGSGGTPAGFPLAPLPGVSGYRRLSPEWPSEEEVDRELIERVRRERPVGRLRQVTSAFGHADDGHVLCGWTQKTPSLRTRFAEPAWQVSRDIDHGMPHRCPAVTGEVVDLTSSSDDVPRLDGMPVELANLPDADPTGERPEAWDWPAHYELMMDNADLYRHERQQ